jgi:hypothetical protein
MEKDKISIQLLRKEKASIIRKLAEVEDNTEQLRERVAKNDEEILCLKAERDQIVSDIDLLKGNNGNSSN